MIKSLLPIGTILRYKAIDVKIIGYSDIHDGKDYVIRHVKPLKNCELIVRYDDKNLEEIK